ncbi:MAG: ABC transporter permease subunit [Flaviflexus sp.]|uniref:ABC transporter permease n=1 Tax=Flaviflexus ciconiae TaxID=2496867 RepID=A0A3Q9G2K8_9ACTO|nr:ABC transporter permease subunit [Flaviflexus ciconiae]AZQ77497.1 hypothetical protein EJ997_09275 [Flaviflexus ciconiae]
MSVIMDPQTYRPTFGRLLKSEFRKFTSLRSTWIITIVAAVLYLLIAFMVAQSMKSYSEYMSFEEAELLGSSYMVTGVFQFMLLFGISFGTIVMTNEYSHNTIQTSLLASRSRMAFYASKLVVLALFWGAVVIVTMVLSTLLIQATIGSMGVSLPMGDLAFWLSIFCCVLVLIMGALMSAGVGALLRSTVGTITLMFGLVLILPVLEIIPLDFIDDLRPYFPINVMTAAVVPREEGILSTFVVSENSLDANVALLVLAIYTALFIAAGALSLKKRDA